MTCSKKTILISLVIIESFLGIIFLNNYYQKRILGINNVTVINKEDTTTIQSDDLKYYWNFLPNTIQEENPNWLSEKVFYHINNDTLNDRFDYPIKKTEKTYRIITLGDSFTYGQYVKTQENWTEKLEDLLNSSLSNCDYDKFEVINLGMPGYDVQYIVQRYQDIGAKYNPDLIVWFESDSGFNRFNELMGPSIKICDNDNLNNDPEFYSTQKVYKCWRDAEEKIFEENTIEHLDGILEKSFESFFKIADQNKTIFFYYDNAWDRKDKIINKLRTQYGGVDFITSISETPNYERFVDGHPNIEGHRSLSQVFFNHLKKRIGCFE